MVRDGVAGAHVLVVEQVGRLVGRPDTAGEAGVLEPRRRGLRRERGRQSFDGGGLVDAEPVLGQIGQVERGHERGPGLRLGRGDGHRPTVRAA